MLSVSLYIELLRTRPHQVFWAAALLQAALWTIIPALFYAAPPGELPLVLAVGHQFQLGTDFGPPLAFWLAEIAYRVAGMFGVYLLSQACIVIAYWAVFTLGRAIVGETHAAVAVLLMVGISAFTVATPEFGPNILATALWALALAHYWLAAWEGRRTYWFVLGVELGVLILTSYAGLVLAALLVLFTVLFPRGRAMLTTVDPWIAGVIAVLVVFPYLMWLDQGGGIGFASLTQIVDTLTAWGRLLVALAVAHAGLLVMLALARGFARKGPAAELERRPINPAARSFVYFFALAPAIAVGVLALFASGPESFVSTPLVLMSGLAVIVMMPDRVRVVHQQLTAIIWSGLLLLPPLLLAVGLMLLPWIYPIELPVMQPAAGIASFVSENFQRRTGKPLTIVAGDQRLAALVALAAPSRPSLFLDATPERTPWVSRQDIANKGTVLVWRANDTRGLPPPALRERFGDIVPELPRAIEWRFQGRLPLFRLGWAVIRPVTPPPSTPAQ